MIDKIVASYDNKSYYIIDKIVLDDKEYFFAVELDEQNQKITDNINVFSINSKNEKIYLEKIEKEKETELLNMFAEKMVNI